MTDYECWIAAHDTLTDEDRRLIRMHVTALPQRPLISVVMPTYETSAELLCEAIASVQAQLYPFWELCIADDASPSGTVPGILEKAAATDSRIRWVQRESNGHISAATNTALELAEGAFVALMDHDDILAETALYEVALALVAHPDADIVYSDEDRIDAEGRRSDPYFKPMWSPELLAGHNMISHLGVYRRTLIRQIGGLREGFEGSQDWDLALRATAATTPDRIHHIPAVLYHWRRNTGTSSFSEAQLARCKEAGRRAVEDWLESEGVVGASVEPARMVPSWTRVAHAMPEPAPFVSVVIPTRDGADLLANACEGILSGTAWPAGQLELTVIDRGSTAPDALAVLRALETRPGVRVQHVDGRLNDAPLINRAVKKARGEILVLLTHGIEIRDPAWLTEMVPFALQREVGVVGAKLIHPDGSLHHGGLVLRPDGPAGQVLPFAPPDEPGYFGQLALARSLSAVSAACMVMRREVFAEVGGFDEDLAVAFSEVDLCLRIRDLGYRIVWTPDAVLTYRESSMCPDQEHDPVPRRSRALEEDPYYNPNLLLHRAGGPLIPAPPRRQKPWRRLAAA